ncbi:hypothetical protein MMC29_000436 [Sticta canariensis]|nr:hypothetical protein [Sticta canariensis]
MPKTARRSSGPRSAPYPLPTSHATSTSKPKPSQKPKANSKPAASHKASSLPAHLSISLPGEETESVPVYDTCDAVREAITSILSPPADPATSYVRELYTKKALAEYMGDITSQSLQRFRDHEGNGEMSGAEMKAYYLGYVFFEKLRVHEGRPKNEARIAAESEFGDRGRELRDPTRKRGGTRGIWVRSGENPNDFLTAEEKAQGLSYRERPLTKGIKVNQGTKGRKNK